MSTHLNLKVPGRVHLTLFDLSGEGYRRHGGIGFSIEKGYVCRAQLSDVISVLDRRLDSVGNRMQIASIVGLLESAMRSHCRFRPIEFEIAEGFSAQQGFGSGTALRLAALESLFLLNGETPSRLELVSLSGRGGVSGVGVNSYFSGGVVVDVGIRNNEKVGFISSDDYGSVDRHPLQLCRVDFPAWNVGICLPNLSSHVPIDDERNLFSTFGRAGEVECSKDVAYEAFFGLLPSIMERDFDCFVSSIEKVQKTYWKSKEWDIHKNSLNGVVELVESLGGRGVALSSVGPGIAFFCPEGSAIEECAPSRGKSSPCLFLTVGNNTGRSISHD